MQVIFFLCASPSTNVFSSSCSVPQTSSTALHCQLQIDYPQYFFNTCELPCITAFSFTKHLLTSWTTLAPCRTKEAAGETQEGQSWTSYGGRTWISVRTNWEEWASEAQREQEEAWLSQETSMLQGRIQDDYWMRLEKGLLEILKYKAKLKESTKLKRVLQILSCSYLQGLSW